MNKRKRRKVRDASRKAEPAATGPYGAGFFRLCREARQRGLYLLALGGGALAAWRRRRKRKAVTA